MSNLNLQKLREWVWPWPWTFNIKVFDTADVVIRAFLKFINVKKL